MRNWELWGGTVETGVSYDAGSLSVGSAKASGLGGLSVAAPAVKTAALTVSDPYSAAIQAGADIFDIFNGGAQKRERTAEAARDEQRYRAEAAQAELALAQARGGGGLGSIGAKLSAPSPIGGLSWGAVGAIAVGGLVLWKVLT